MMKFIDEIFIDNKKNVEFKYKYILNVYFTDNDEKV